MRLIKLVHPVHGLVDQKILYNCNSKKKAIYDWKHKYGKKYYDCDIEVYDDEPVKLKKVPLNMKPIINIKTGERYKSTRDAAKKTGKRPQTIYMHCRRKYRIGFDYLFRYA